MIDENTEEIIDESGGEYSRKSDFNKGQIVAEHIKRILTLRSKEMKDGFVNYIKDKDGNVHRQDLPDPRQEYFGGVDSLIAILSPEIYREEETTAALLEFKKQKQKLFTKFAYREYYPKIFVENCKSLLKFSGEVYMPQKGEKVIVGLAAQGSSKPLVMKTDTWDYEINRYRDALIPIYDEIFSVLNKLIDTLNYFKQSAGF